MDISSFPINLNPFKEPRGFIRILQFVLSICAFGTTTNFSSYFSFQVKCTENGTAITQTVTQTIEYPFKLDHEQMHLEACGSAYDHVFFGDYSSDAQFFVASGVLSMLFSLASVVLYSACEKMYQENPTIPFVDFLISLGLGVFWISGSAAWASGLNALKYVCNPKSFIGSLPFCVGPNSCVSEFAGNFAGLNISIILGFLNFFLWAANLWFLYKETSWFQQNPAPEGVTGGVTTPTV